MLENVYSPSSLMRTMNYRCHSPGRIKTQTIVGVICLACLVVLQCLQADEPIDVGSRRQLFVDRHLIDTQENLRQVLHHPVRRGIAIQAEHPWENAGVSYMVSFRDGDKFRAWYRVDTAKFNFSDSRSMTAYAESNDGIHWHKPKLGIIEFAGSKQNNLVWDEPGLVNMAVFRDDNPEARSDERYKALIRGRNIFALVSADGLHWRKAGDEPILDDPPFDSHNIAFWDPLTKHYLAYTRGVRLDGRLGQGMTSRFKGGVRWVRHSRSTDFRHWTALQPIQTGDSPREEFYTNSTIRYERAPDFLFMFPSRFASARKPNPDWKHGAGVNDIAFLSSRDGLQFDRTFMQAFIRPGTDDGNWHERSLYMERGVLQTSPTELSLYCMQNWRLPTVHIRRYTLRSDGFVSIQAGYSQGELVSNPLQFNGDELHLNFSTSAVGFIKVEIMKADGGAIDGLRLADCPEIYGDKIDGHVDWTSDAKLADLANTAVRLRFVLSDADLYAFRFSEASDDL